MRVDVNPAREDLVGHDVTCMGKAIEDVKTRFLDVHQVVVGIDAGVEAHSSMRARRGVTEVLLEGFEGVRVGFPLDEEEVVRVGVEIVELA